jgi:hypothetical protein
LEPTKAVMKRQEEAAKKKEEQKRATESAGGEKKWVMTGKVDPDKLLGITREAEKPLSHYEMQAKAERRAREKEAQERAQAGKKPWLNSTHKDAGASVDAVRPISPRKDVGKDGIADKIAKSPDSSAQPPRSPRGDPDERIATKVTSAPYPYSMSTSPPVVRPDPDAKIATKITALPRPLTAPAPPTPTASASASGADGTMTSPRRASGQHAADHVHSDAFPWLTSQ